MVLPSHIELINLVHGEDVRNPSRSAISIAAITTNYALAGKKQTVLNKNWKKPSEGFLLINVDAAYNDAKGAGSTGAVIRDAADGFIAAAHSYIPHMVDAANRRERGGWMMAHGRLGLLVGWMMIDGPLGLGIETGILLGLMSRSRFFYFFFFSFLLFIILPHLSLSWNTVEALV